jgi:hypothetical protein
MAFACHCLWCPVEANRSVAVAGMTTGTTKLALNYLLSILGVVETTKNDVAEIGPALKRAPQVHEGPCMNSASFDESFIVAAKDSDRELAVGT